jgi:hypothetical protein
MYAVSFHGFSQPCRKVWSIPLELLSIKCGVSGRDREKRTLSSGSLFGKHIGEMMGFLISRNHPDSK